MRFLPQACKCIADLHFGIDIDIEFEYYDYQS